MKHSRALLPDNRSSATGQQRLHSMHMRSVLRFGVGAWDCSSGWGRE